jgi:hypothetical protein
MSNQELKNNICTPCQEKAMSNMSVQQRIIFLRQLGLTKELQALEATLSAKDYTIPKPLAIY